MATLVEYIPEEFIKHFISALIKIVLLQKQSEYIYVCIFIYLYIKLSSITGSLGDLTKALIFYKAEEKFISLLLESRVFLISWVQFVVLSALCLTLLSIGV